MYTVTCKGWWWAKEKGRGEGGLEMVGGDTSSGGSQVAHTGTQGVCCVPCTTTAVKCGPL